MSTFRVVSLSLVCWSAFPAMAKDFLSDSLTARRNELVENKGFGNKANDEHVITYSGTTTGETPRGCTLRFFLEDGKSFSAFATIKSVNSENDSSKLIERFGAYFKKIPSATRDILSDGFKTSQTGAIKLPLNRYNETAKRDFAFVQNSWWDAEKRILSFYEDFSYEERLDSKFIPWSAVQFKTVNAYKALAVYFSDSDTSKPKAYVWTSLSVAPIFNNFGHRKDLAVLLEDNSIIKRLDSGHGYDLSLPTSYEAGVTQQITCEL